MPSRRTALLISINHRYINPTNSLLPAVLQKFCDVHFYGPGYVTQATLDKGVQRYVDALGGVDLILSTIQCCGDWGATRLNRFLVRSAVLLNGGHVTPAFLKDVTAFCRAHRNRVLVALTDLDPHAAQQSTLDSLLEHAAHFMGWGSGFLGALGDAEAVKNEQYLQKKLRMSLPLGLLDRFVDRYRTQIINIGHFVADTEFYWSGLAVREYDAAVPGSRYARRREARSALRKLDAIRMAGLWYRYLYQIATRLAARPYANFFLLHLYNLAFQRAISQSKVCVTDGGANNYPVRKFFEIPAAGALMLCWPSVGLELLGFKDGVNCIFVREEADILRTIETVIREVERFEPIAAAGRDLVFREHSVSARAAQLQAAVERIEAGTFSGSFWQDGRFHCVPESRDVRDADLMNAVTSRLR